MQKVQNQLKIQELEQTKPQKKLDYNLILF